MLVDLMRPGWSVSMLKAGSCLVADSVGTGPED